MMQFGLIGIGAGLASALLFASVATGSLLSVVLFYLAPLPLMIAALGWSHWAALIGALIGALALSAAFGSLFLLAFLACAGLPAWWLGYLAMLARPASANGGAPALEWFPPGRLVIWAGLTAALVVAVGILSYGGDAESFRTGLHKTLVELLQAETEQPANAPLAIPGVSNPQRLVDFLVLTVPLAGAIIATIVNLLNLWLAGRIVNYSGRLARPWPRLAAMTFPRLLAAIFLLALALSFAGGLVGILASVLTASLVIAFGALGLAVLHTITQGINARGLLLVGAYAAVVVFGWPVLALAVLGLIETFAGLRARFGRPPPA
jgi:hypothetical protein